MRNGINDQTSAVFTGVLVALLVVRWITNLDAGPETTYWIDKHGRAQYSEDFSADRSSGTVATTVRDPSTGRAVYFLHKGCTVVSPRDWYCDDGLTSNNGEVTDQVSESDYRIRSVSVFHWWLARANGWLYPTPTNAPTAQH